MALLRLLERLMARSSAGAEREGPTVRKTSAKVDVAAVSLLPTLLFVLFTAAVGFHCSENASRGSLQVDAAVDAADDTFQPQDSRDAGSSVGAGATCASREGDASCFGNCGAHEICFTQIICPITPDGSAPCYPASPAQGDDRCHRRCDEGAQCAAGEDCFEFPIVECTDYGGPQGICCLAATGCGSR